MFTLEIKPMESEPADSYYYDRGFLMKSQLGELLVTAIAFIRFIFLTSIFVIINLVLLYSSVKFVRRKRDLLSSTRLKKPSNGQAREAPENDCSENRSLMGLNTSDKPANDPKLSTRLSISNLETNLKQSNQHNNQSAEWNLTKMTLFISLIYLFNTLFYLCSFILTKLDHDNYTLVVIFDLIATNLVQITNIFEITSYFLFNRFFRRGFRKLTANLVKFFFAK